MSMLLNFSLRFPCSQRAAMSLRPVQAYGPIAAFPILPLALNKIARTPIARLAIGFELIPPRRVCPFRAALLSLATYKLRYDRLRGLGESLDVDRLLAGGVAGTWLDLLEREIDFAPAPDPALEAQLDCFA
jgi:hypothetical protein